MRTGFIGGAMPLYMRLPKRGFSNAPFREKGVIVDLGKIQDKFNAGERIDRKSLLEKGLIREKKAPVKILGPGTDLTKAFNFVGITRFSRSAKKAIEEKGGTIAES